VTGIGRRRTYVEIETIVDNVVGSLWEKRVGRIKRLNPAAPKKGVFENPSVENGPETSSVKGFGLNNGANQLLSRAALEGA
jgi:hypothetical protein